MAWTTPQTWTTGLIDANGTSGLNTQLRDNMLSARQMWDAAIHLSLSTDFGIPNNANTKVAWDVLDWQANSSVVLWASASGSKLLAPIAGQYELGGCLEWGGASGGYRASKYNMSSTGAVFFMSAYEIGLARGANTPIADVINMTSGTFLEINAFQNSGATHHITGGKPDKSRVSWRLIGAAS